MRGREEALNGPEPITAATDLGKTPVLRRIVGHVARILRPAAVHSADTAFPPADARGIGEIRNFGVVVCCSRAFKLLDIECGGVADGLGAVAQRPGRSDPSPPVPGSSEPEGRVRPIPLLVEARVRTTWLPDQHLPRIRETTLLRTVSVCASRWRSPGEGLQSRAVPLLQPSGVTDGGTGISLSPVEVRIRDATQLARDVPHSRTGVPPAEISTDDAALFTREAEELHGIAADRAELLTFFRRVPIDAISRLRLTENATKLLFEVTSSRNRTRARVHDLAAVRDTGNSEVYLVPHRNRYHTAHLS